MGGSVAEVIADGHDAAESIELSDASDALVELLAGAGDEDALAEAFRRRVASAEAVGD